MFLDVYEKTEILVNILWKWGEGMFIETAMS